MDTEEEFKDMTASTAVDSDDLALLTEVDDDEPIELDEKLPDEETSDTDLKDLDVKDPEEDDDVEAEIAAYIFQDYDER